MVLNMVILSACKSVSSTSEEKTSGSAYADEIDKTQIMTFEISADENDWQTMLDNAEAEEYISADVTINGTTIKNVGIRPKGNSSLSQVARDDTTDRYSFKIKFDEYVDGQTWMGLDKIVINNMFSDATYMKEYLSYDIMDYIGVEAPLYSFADISVNGDNWGFYLAVEDIDDGYMNRVFDGEGELYKPNNDDNQAQGFGNGGKSNESQQDTGQDIKTDKSQKDTSQEAKTDETLKDTAQDTKAESNNELKDDAVQNTSENVSQENIKKNADSTDNSQESSNSGKEDNQEDNFGQDRGFGGGMNGMADNGVSLQYTDDETSSYSAIFDNAETDADESDYERVITALKNLNDGTDLETYINVEEVLKYFAAQTVVVNLDSYISNMGHNYYLYEKDGQLSILPWDYNLSFGGFQSEDAADVVNFPIDTPVSGVSLEDRPLLGKLLEVPEYLELYHSYLKEIIDGYFSDGKFDEKVDSLDKLISAYVEKDSSAFYTFDEYNTAVEQLKELGNLRAQSIEGQLAGTIPSTTEGQEENPDALIDASSVDISSLGSQGGGDKGGQMPGAGGGGFGQKGDFNLPEGIDMDTLIKAREIIGNTQADGLTDEQKEKLKDLGLSDQQIEELLQMPGDGRGNGNSP